MDSITSDLFGFSMAAPIWWLIFYALFVGLNIVGVEASFRFSVFICLAALSILLCLGGSGYQAGLSDIKRSTASGAGSRRVSVASLRIPFAIWFYLAIEELRWPRKNPMTPSDIPRGTIYGCSP
jgi:ethanolamine permease